jgi:hypothetical protein
MKAPYGQMLKTAGLAFVLGAAIHFAIPPSAAASSCTCSNLSFVASATGSGADCATANTFLDINIQEAESTACFPNDYCRLQSLVITSACQLKNGHYEISGSQRYSCYIGTNCPRGH